MRQITVYVHTGPPVANPLFYRPRRTYLSTFIAMKSYPNTACDTLISSFRYPRFYWLFNLIARLPCCSVIESRESTFHVRSCGRGIMGRVSAEQVLRLRLLAFSKGILVSSDAFSGYYVYLNSFSRGCNIFERRNYFCIQIN